jgi:hypothetical protein
VVGKVGDRISSYFSDFGKLDGRISDIVAGGFLLELAMDRAMRAKLANQLSWLEKKQKDPTVRDARQQARIIPVRPHSMLTFADGSMHSCFVIDMSISGAAVSADVQPPIGTALALGACVGRVVRHLDDGFAIKFAELQHRGELDRRISRPPPLQGAAAPRGAPRADLAALAPPAAAPPDQSHVVYLDV